MICNFGQVDSWLFRGGHYRLRDLAEAVGRYGIQRVIDLRDRAPLFKPASYQRIGVEFVRCPLSEHEPLPANILDVLDPNYITFVHCWKGSHRTGAFIGLYRRQCQGWSPDRIWDEMQAYGFGRPEDHMALYRSIFE